MEPSRIHLIYLSMGFSFFTNEKNDYWLYNNNMPYEDIKSKVVHYDASKGAVKEQYFPIDMHIANYFFVVEGNNFVKRRVICFSFLVHQREFIL